MAELIDPNSRRMKYWTDQPHRPFDTWMLATLFPERYIQPTWLASGQHTKPMTPLLGVPASIKQGEVMDALEEFWACRMRSPTATELGKELGRSHRDVYRLLQNLVRRGYVIVEIATSGTQAYWFTASVRQRFGLPPTEIE